MRGVLSIHITRRILIAFAVFLLGLCALSLSLDLAEQADKVLNVSGGNVLALGRYMALRLPDILAQMLPAAALLSAMMVIAQMLRSGELVALWAGGFSPINFLRALVPAFLVVGTLHFLNIELLVPGTRAALRDWGVTSLKENGLFDSDSPMLWLMSGDDIIRLPRNAVTAGPPFPLTVFVRNTAGVLQERLDAQAAERVDDDHWRLTDVSRSTIEPAATETVPSMLWQGHIDLAGLPLLAATQRDLQISDLLRLIDSKGYGQRPVNRFEAWLQARLASPLIPILMIALVVALAQRFRRHGAIGSLLLSSLAIGFAFSAFDGVSVAFGEAGLLPPWFAAWGPKLALAALIASQVTAQEV